MKQRPAPSDAAPEPRDGYGIATMPLGGGGSGGARSRRILPALVVGIGLAVVGIGLLGPKGDGTPANRATPGASQVPVASGPTAAARTSPSPSPVRSPVPITGLPALLASGPPLADPFVLLGGRWVDVRTSVAQQTNCASGALLVLAGGRIVCIFEATSRRLGASTVNLTLSASTFGRVRADPGATAPTDVPTPQGPGRAEILATLKGRADVTADGRPVAAVVAAGARRDTLLIAWATLDADGYRLGLDLYRMAGARAIRDGRVAFARISVAGVGDVGLADLAVSIAPDGRHALVGISMLPPPPGWGWPIRRLWVVPVGQSKPGSPVGLPVGVAPGDHPCGGSSQEGFATNGAIYLVCEVGDGIAIRRYDVRTPARPRFLGESRVEVGGAQGGRLDGTTVVDRAHDLWYRWMPVAGRLARVDLARGGDPAVIDLPTGTVPGWSDPPDAQGPRWVGTQATHPLLALSPDGDRAYLLGLPTSVVRELGGRGPGVDVVDARTMAPLERWSAGPTEPSGLVLSTDGRLAYLSTDPIGEPAGGRTIALVVRDSTHGAERLLAGHLPTGVDDSLLPLIVR